MKHGEFSLDGYLFGTGHPVYPSSLNRGNIGWRTHDVENPVGDTLFFGKDYRAPQPWKFEFTITGETPAEAAENMAGLIQAWDSLPVQREAGAEQVLIFNRHGREFRIYGRSRDLEIEDNDAWVLETITGTGEFQPSGTTVYGEDKQAITLTITPGRAGGLVFPAVFPWGATQGQQRAGVIEAGGGLIPTNDVELHIKGPITNPVVTGPGWVLKFAITLAYDESITVNARKRTVLLNNSGSAAGKLDRSSRLENIIIPPGQSEITFEGTDLTGTSQLTVSWRPAFV